VTTGHKEKWRALYLLQGKEGMKKYDEDLKEDE
jgi:hypothetical protein